VVSRSFGFDFGQLKGLRLAEQVQLLSDHIIELESLYLATPTRPRFSGGDFTPAEATIAAALLRGELTMEFLAQLLYGGRREIDQPRDARQNIRKFISRVRLKLRPYAVEIKTRHGVGWYLDYKSLANLKLLLVAAPSSRNDRNEPVRDSQSSHT
jgi:hypothetical protein